MAPLGWWDVSEKKCRLVGDLGNQFGKLGPIRDGKVRIARGLRQMEVAMVCVIGEWPSDFMSPRVGLGIILRNSL